jgi:hypothetical protein
MVSDSSRGVDAPTVRLRKIGPPIVIRRLPRFLLGASSALLALGGLMHARAFGKAAAAAASSNLPAFYADSLRALWLIDSATLLVLASVFGLIAARPLMAAGSVLVLLALIPAATAAFLYTFIGMFLPAHVLLAAAIMAAAAGMFRARG